MPTNNVNTTYNGECFEKDIFSTTGGQKRQIDQAVHTMISSSEWTQVQLGSRQGLCHMCIAQLAIQKEACSWKKTGTTLSKQQTNKQSIED